MRKEDWEDWQDREDRLRQDCGKQGKFSTHGNDWGVEDRQADDRARAEENAAKRQRREWASQGRDYAGNYPEQAISTNTTRRWSGNHDWGKETKR